MRRSRRDVLRVGLASLAGSALLPPDGGAYATTPGTASAPAAPPRPYRAARYPGPRFVAKSREDAWFLPAPPAYPTAIPREQLLRDAQGYSDALRGYVDAWLAGRAPARLPDAFVPPGVWRRDFPGFTLQRVEETRPERQWLQRPAHFIDPAALHGAFPDPNCTYLIAMLFAPFGATLVLEGEFPHARFFDAQISPSFDPASYRYDGGVGVGEVPIVDVDIEPLPGHVNPFRIGARRDAAARGYRLEFPLAIGDPVALNEAFRPPHFRAPGNVRVGGALFFQGPWGAYRGIGGHGRGAWDIGQLWLRYYRPDDARGPLAGVPLPRMKYRLEDGREFWLQVDGSGLVRRANRTVSLPPGSLEPDARANETPEYGWVKQVGIFRSVVGGIALGSRLASPKYVRDLDRGVAGRGHDLAPPNDYEQSATSCTYIDYLVRGMSCARGKVVVLTGRLPLTPRTRAGAPVAERGEARYWSLVGYHVPTGWDFLKAFSPDAVNGVAQHAVMDEEVVLQAGRRFVIALSRPEDRPRNAVAEAGVTWVDWGVAPKVSWTLRWLTVGPEWTADSAPTRARVGKDGDWAHPQFDPARLWRHNDGRGLLGEYQPQVHYLARSEFEALGARVAPGDVPVWKI